MKSVVDANTVIWPGTERNFLEDLHVCKGERALPMISIHLFDIVISGDKNTIEGPKWFMNSAKMSACGRR